MSAVISVTAYYATPVLIGETLAAIIPMAESTIPFSATRCLSRLKGPLTLAPFQIVDVSARADADTDVTERIPTMERIPRSGVLVHSAGKENVGFAELHNIFGRYCVECALTAAATALSVVPRLHAYAKASPCTGER